MKREHRSPRLSAFIARGFGLLRRGLKMGVISGIGLLVPAGMSCVESEGGMYGGPSVHECKTDNDCIKNCGTGWYCHSYPNAFDPPGGTVCLPVGYDTEGGFSLMTECQGDGDSEAEPEADAETDSADREAGEE